MLIIKIARAKGIEVRFRNETSFNCIKRKRIRGGGKVLAVSWSLNNRESLYNVKLNFKFYDRENSVVLIDPLPQLHQMFLTFQHLVQTQLKTFPKVITRYYLFSNYFVTTSCRSTR